MTNQSKELLIERIKRDKLELLQVELPPDSLKIVEFINFCQIIGRLVDGMSVQNIEESLKKLDAACAFLKSGSEGLPDGHDIRKALLKMSRAYMAVGGMAMDELS